MEIYNYYEPFSHKQSVKDLMVYSHFDSYIYLIQTDVCYVCIIVTDFFTV